MLGRKTWGTRPPDPLGFIAFGPPQPAQKADRGRPRRAIIPCGGGAAEALGPALSEAEWVGSHRSPILLSGRGILARAAVAVKR